MNPNDESQNWAKIRERVNAVPWSLIERKTRLYRIARFFATLGWSMIILAGIYVMACICYGLAIKHPHYYGAMVIIGIAFSGGGWWAIWKFDLWEIKLKDCL